MRFHGAFTCIKCGQEFTIDLGPQKMGELKRPKVVGQFIGELAVLFAKSCIDHERDCEVVADTGSLGQGWSAPQPGKEAK